MFAACVVSTPILVHKTLVDHGLCGSSRMIVFLRRPASCAIFAGGTTNMKTLKWLLLSAVAWGWRQVRNTMPSFLGSSSRGRMFSLRTGFTGRQLQAIRWGGLFFLVVLAAAAPWFVKNLILTVTRSTPSWTTCWRWSTAPRNSRFLAAGDADAWGYNLIRNRTLFYGEEVWQIPAAAVADFFRRQGPLPPHFDGVLRPLFAL